MGDVIKLKCYLIKLIEQVKYKIKRSKWGRGEYKKKVDDPWLMVVVVAKLLQTNL